LALWDKNQSNDDEEFWEQALAERTFLLSQLFAYPVVVIRKKAYVGGKEVTNKGGNIVDFLGRTESTHSAILIEIKTPETLLLSSEYRDRAYPFSRHVAGAITQVLRYRQSFMRDFYSVTRNLEKPLSAVEPRCLVIAGHTSQLDNDDKRESFDVQRERLQGVTVITYDEMFVRLRKLLELFDLSGAA
jgi:hypothetical protein